MTSPPVADAQARAVIAAGAASSKKAEDILVLDVGDIISITDFFVIASASNPRLVRTIVDEVERAMKEEASVSPRGTEGLDDASWVLLDYGDVVVHIFAPEEREYYHLEDLWADAPRVDWSSAIAAS